MSNFRALRAAVIIPLLSLTLAACSLSEDAPGGTAASNTSATTTAPGARSPGNGTAASATPNSTSVAEVLASHGLSGMDAVQMVNHLDNLPVPERPTDMLAAVHHAELRISVEGDEAVLPLPEGQTYISIAPFADQTHSCFYHSLTTCLGELNNEPISITIRDDNTGDLLVDADTTTYDNGFIGFWLPTGAAGTIEVTHAGRSGSTEFSTEEDGATCVTTLQVT